MSLGMLSIAREELRRYNGRSGAPAYIAYEGSVYDVPSSFLWRNGKHQVLHEAGCDLAGCLDQAPHGEDFLKRFPVVGALSGD